ncbi:MAG: hypothetical protein UU73_C0002G0147 [Candidatus Daviesbacteria bacterium GW2011_GWA1_41_61]|uniref:Uncharacterized protein n=1 Tax=Candidatus Daviesbacteria bacterium GW2011_GWA2_40_9 TaxID=1618424 RepID=A0A0G0WGK1_9BACT|nr:MAG: hypothetical protein UU26_C0009G0055 [Candidatus Daviesbacteria bacterium GW2011_GWC1_40_9]KKR83425.1 MAG: hypothetical protein UU29_C0005G0006 [Candidatus Daviesbacteria bacterium GW2011_GWA2_40_9]KKR93807.1 MAG: hypothetical protein UU44_C0001G0147 [Candidatus Daviesbacteria bacterium GW2011_GWB1_41_15]KKS15273.1 MAG: hypothetical protein UU73_C0002G0147 [Candidatus Daviesbacteria bacterium GW2011_GWA1_41_61]
MPKNSFIPLLLIFTAITLLAVVLKVEPPQSLHEATLPQLGLFFIPLGIFLTIFTHLILKNWAKSAFLSLGLILLLFLKSLSILNSLIFFLGVLSIILILKFITKPPKARFYHSIKEEKLHLLKPLPKAKLPKLTRTTPKPKVRISRLENK